MKNETKKGFYFKQYEAPFQSPFDKLFDVFKELITHTSGDFDEAIDWLRKLDKEYKLTDENYTIDDFVEDLKKKGFKFVGPTTVYAFMQSIGMVNDHLTTCPIHQKVLESYSK